jgi:hypothetical protein
MLVTIHQPDFLPWGGFFARMAEADLYVVLDDVQFIRRGWQHRDKIKTSKGPVWLSLPVKKSGLFKQRICDVEVESVSATVDVILGKLEAHYRKAPNFASCFQALEDVLNSWKTFRMVDLNLGLIQFAREYLGIVTPLRFSSEFGIESSSSQRLVDLMEAVGGSRYMTGSGSRAYLEEGLFYDKGIEVIWHQYQCREYPQLHGDFAPGLSIIDAMMMGVFRGLYK